MDNSALVHHIDQALRANYIMLRDIDYVVDEGKVKIVDGFTGRIMEGRRYSDGLTKRLKLKKALKLKTSLKQWRQSLTKTTPYVS